MCKLQIVKAHDQGVPAPSIHDKRPVLSGVRAMCLRADNQELVTGGADGYYVCWALANGDISHVTERRQVGVSSHPARTVCIRTCWQCAFCSRLAHRD